MIGVLVLSPDTRCRIGKVIFKNGTELHPFRKTHLSEVKSKTHYDCLDEVSKYVRAGRVSAMAVCIAYDGGFTMNWTEKAPGILSMSLAGMIGSLYEFHMKNWK